MPGLTSLPHLTPQPPFCNLKKRRDSTAEVFSMARAQIASSDPKWRDFNRGPSGWELAPIWLMESDSRIEIARR